MAVNEYVNRVETVNNEVLMDISEDTVTESDVLKGKTFHLANGAPAVGTRNECDCGDFDILEGNLPISFKGNGNPLYNYEIKGNNNINRVDEIQSTLPVSIDTYGGNAVDWEIYGNNNPVVENKTGTLPINASATAGNLLDWTINGNNNSGKNVVQLGESQTVNGVTLTIDSQAGTVIMNGDTTSAEAGFSVNLFDTSSLVGGDYIFSGGADGGSSTTYDLYLYNRTDQVYVGRLYNSSDIISATIESGKRYTVYVQCRKGQVYDNIVFKPMLRPANTTSTFEPYTVGVGERTKNLLEITADSQTIKGVLFTVDKHAGTVTATGSASANQEYYLEGDLKRDISDGRLVNGEVMSSLGLENGGRFVLSYYDADQVFISGTQQVVTESVQSVEISIPANAAYYRFYLRKLPNYENDVTFKPMLRKADASSVFVPYGYQIPLDIWHKTKNLLDITGYNRNHYSVLWYEDNGQLKASGTYSDSAAHTWPRFYVNLNAGTYTLSGSPNYEQSGVSLQIGTCTDEDGSNFSSLGYDRGTGYTFTLQSDSWVSIRVYTASSLYQQTIDLTLPIMLRLADTSSDFEPYYLTNHEDIYIGNSPLTQGQSITKAQSGQDIALFNGDNIIDTSLYNKPNTSITYNSSVLGVGERTENLINPDETTQGDGYIASHMLTGNGVVSAEWAFISEYIPVEAGMSYCIFRDLYRSSNSSTKKRSVVVFYDADKTEIDYDEILWQLTQVEYDVTNCDVFSTPENCKYIRISVDRNSTLNMLIKGSVPPSKYIPFGYQIPLLVTSGQQSTPHTIYIGSVPLTEGQSVTKASSSTDIALYQGENTISTTLGNKPEMKIDYLSTVVGVGERTKNYINYTDIDATDYGVHCYWENDSVHVEGTFSESTPKAPTPFRRFCYLEAGTYILSGSTDYTTTGFHLQIGTCSDDAGSNFTIMGYDNGSGYTFTLQDASYVGVRIHIAAAASGQQIDAVMPIMLRREDTTPGFIPYGYQIPIQIIQRTENLFNKNAPYTSGKYLNTSGEEVSGATWGISEYIPIEDNTTYTAYNLSGGGASACWYDENKNFISGENYGGATSKSFSLPSNAKYIRITIRLLNPSNIDTLMLIKGSTSPENYIPYYNIIEKDIYIGDSPLLEGQSVTKELLLEDIPTYNGETIIDTTLYNKPYSIIIPTNKAANIIKEIQKLWDAVKSINPSSQSNSIDILKKRIKLSNNVDSPIIIANITDVKVYEEDTQNSSNQESGDLI